ncbi:proteoglycan 4-like [Mercenaria mercenaria]|uniref:proteoglycan 4-like n=1 Tax=Mercenaria mercenaria TaxID=6596 RepID=UPI00234F88C1|nr:proteoglycan 4-like [Mercenaria mercenaria]
MRVVLVLIVVIVTVTSVRSLHPYPKNVYKGVKGGFQATGKYDNKRFGPTKTKKGKRPSRIGNIDVNLIRTVGADVGLRGLAEANNRGANTAEKNDKNATNAPSSYRKTQKYGTIVNKYKTSASNSTSFNTEQQKQYNIQSAYSAGNTYSANKDFLANFLKTLVIGDTGTDNSNSVSTSSYGNTKSLKSSNYQTKDIKKSYGFSKDANLQNGNGYLKPTKKSSSKRNFSNQYKVNKAFDPWKLDLGTPDFGRPDKQDPTQQEYGLQGSQFISTPDFGKPDESNSKVNIARPNKQDYTSLNVERLSSGSSTSRLSKKKLTFKSSSQQYSKVSDIDFGRPDKPDLIKTTYGNNAKPYGPTYKKQIKSTASKLDFNGPGKPEPYGPNYGQPATKAPLKPDFNRPDKPKPYGSNYGPPATKAPSKPEFNRPDKQKPYGPNYGPPATKAPYKPDFNRPDKSKPYGPNYGPPATKAPYKPDFNRPDQPKPYDPKYGQPATKAPSKPDFNRPDKAKPYGPNYGPPATIAP